MILSQLKMRESNLAEPLIGISTLIQRIRVEGYQITVEVLQLRQSLNFSPIKRKDRDKIIGVTEEK